MTIQKTDEVITIFGGSGFLGRHVVQALARRGYRIRVACRRPDLAGHLRPLGNVGQIQAIQANLRVRWSVDRAVEGSSHVVNLVGVLYESGRQTFNAVQDFGARAVAEATRAEGIGLTHMSALGADPDSESGYARTKAAGEAAVLSTVKDAVVFRPSVIFGPEDGFFNRFASMARLSPFLPAIGGGKTLFQPVYVGDVAEAIARSVDGQVRGGRVYELGGPQVQSFREWMDEMLEIIDRKRIFVPVPWWAASMIGSVAGLFPNPPLTADQVLLLQHDNIVSEAAKKDKRTFDGIGIRPKAAGAILPSYLWTYRRAGQYTRPQQG